MSGERTQTLRGLATWLESMDRPDSRWRHVTTMQDIVEEAKLALANDDEQRDRYKQERDQLAKAIGEHRAEKAHGPTANMNHADERLYSALDSIEGRG